MQKLNKIEGYSRILLVITIVADDLSLAMCLPGRHAPSLESMSGFSTNSRASTATIVRKE